MPSTIRTGSTDYRCINLIIQGCYRYIQGMSSVIGSAFKGSSIYHCCTCINSTELSSIWRFTYCFLYSDIAVEFAGMCSDIYSAKHFSMFEAVDLNVLNIMGMVKKTTATFKLLLLLLLKHMYTG